ncbi:MAG: hypothetical protein R2911_08780 [Caldilineaceae bacterium]
MASSHWSLWLDWRQFSIGQWLLGLLWFLIPVAGVLTLALFVPKFNERYVMIGLPGLVLVWSLGLGRAEGEKGGRGEGE